jgi:Mg/Co/Ni transporter MgtE
MYGLLLSGVFAATALVLTLVALYAISMHEVVTRERELGVRVALAVVLTMAAAALVTSIRPILRAGGVSPNVAMRSE